MKQKIIFFLAAFGLGYVAHVGVVAWRDESYRSDAEAYIREAVKVGDDAAQIEGSLKKLNLGVNYDNATHRYHGIFPRSKACPRFFIEIDGKGKVKDIKVYYPIVI